MNLPLGEVINESLQPLLAERRSGQVLTSDLAQTGARMECRGARKSVWCSTGRTARHRETSLKAALLPGKTGHERVSEHEKRRLNLMSGRASRGILPVPAAPSRDLP